MTARRAEKSPEAFRTISEVSDILEIPAHVLRFWETKFSQIRPVKRGGGRRYYRPEDIELLAGLQDLLHVQHMTIKGAQKVLKEQGVRHVMEIGRKGAPVAARGLAEIAADLAALRDRMVAAMAA